MNTYDSDREQERLRLQGRLDEKKARAERNRLGQFATPTGLARDILRFGVTALDKQHPIRFLDPAIGTGSFFSALLHTVALDQIEAAKGYELDPYYGILARDLWRGSVLDLELADFTRVTAPASDADRFNLLICNPPYVRHHHLANGEKRRLQAECQSTCGYRISGLAGLYCYSIALSHGWMREGAVAGWLVPSEFMDVNYGEAVRRYLLQKVTLLRFHRFTPDDVQFDDTLVSSAVVWLRNDPPPKEHVVEFTLGGSLFIPGTSAAIAASSLWTESKWTRFPALGVRTSAALYHLSGFFTIKRGIATGNNKFFIRGRQC